MDAKEIKSRLSDIDIKRIIESLGGEVWSDDEDKIIFNTLCHGGDSPNKLCYFKQDKYFYCFTHCGVTDVLAIISEVKDLNLPQSIDYICTLLGISTIREGFGKEGIDIIDDWSFINSYKSKYIKLNKPQKDIAILDKNILNMFQEIYTSDWINDGISKETMNRYNILYSTMRQSIIIPHYDIESNLIGVRQRAMLDFDIDTYGKYTPFSLCGDMYNHSLSQSFYGIHMNSEIIKKHKKVMLVESEKGVLQIDSMFGCDNNFTLALCGCAKVSNTQRNILLNLGVTEVIIALDRQFEVVGDENYISWKKHMIKKIISPLLPYFKVYVIWDESNLLKYKQSPTDCGKDTLLKLMKNKIYVEEGL